ncbi:MAG: FecR domain-containing protein, partial [Candidatus Dadabacteria bacterium]|nr:FecR domain-containing protein [Candidatus Dadabacteria bacterium]
MKPTLKTVKAIACLGLLIFASTGINPAEGQDAGDALVIFSKGFSDVRFSGKQQFTPLETGMRLSVGDMIQTDTESEVEIRLADKSVLKIGPSSRVLIKELGTVEVTKVSTTTFELIKGKIRAVVSPLIKSQSRFIIETTNATVGVRGTDFVESFDPDTESTYVIGLNDCVSLALKKFPGSVPVTICGSEELTVTGREAPSAPAKAPPETINRVLTEMGLTGGTGSAAPGERKAPYITAVLVNRTVDLERIEGTLTLTRDDLTVNGTIGIGGQAKDDGGRVTTVQVSLDGGITYETAAGTESWAFEFKPRENTEYSLMVRAVNDAGLVSDPRDMGPITIIYRNESYEDVARRFVDAFIAGVRAEDARAIEELIADGYDGVVGGFYSRDELIREGVEELTGRIIGTTITYTLDQVSVLGDRVVVVTGWSVTSGAKSDRGRTTWWLLKSESFKLSHADGDWVLRSLGVPEPGITLSVISIPLTPPCD